MADKETEYKDFMRELAEVFSEDNIGMDPDILEESISRDEHSIHVIKEQYELREQELNAEIEQQQAQLNEQKKQFELEKRQFTEFREKWLAQHDDNEQLASVNHSNVQDLLEHVKKRDEQLRSTLINSHRLIEQYISQNKRFEHDSPSDNDFLYMNITDLTTSLKKQIVKLQESFIAEVNFQSQELQEMIRDPKFLFSDKPSAEQIAEPNNTPETPGYDFEAFKQRLKKYHKQLNDWYTLQALDRPDELPEDQMLEEDITPQDSIAFFNNLRAAKDQETEGSDTSGPAAVDFDPEGGQSVICQKWDDYYVDGKSIREWYDALGPGQELLDIVEGGDNTATLYFDTETICTLRRIG